MDKIQNNATVVANESANVAVETTSIYNLNSDQMKKKGIATNVAQESVADADATIENGNAAEDAASMNQKVVPTTKIAKINDEYVEIILAYTQYSMELPEYNEKLCQKLDRSIMLPIIFNLANPDVFWNEGVQLYDRAGNVIEQGTANVYVDCSTADSWRVWIDEKLERVELHDYASVKDYAKAIGCSNLYSRGMNNTEKIGIASLATGNEAYKTVFEFAKKHGLTSTAANLYLNVKMTKLQMMKMSTGSEPKAKPELGRSIEEAEALLTQVSAKFGEENARKRYAIGAINILNCQKKYNLKVITNAVQELSEIELDQFKTAPSDCRVSTISVTLTEHINASLSKEVITHDAA